MALSFFVGQKKNPIDYDLKSIGIYILVAAILFAIAEYAPIGNTILHLCFNTALLAIFLLLIVKKEQFNVLAILKRRS